VKRLHLFLLLVLVATPKARAQEAASVSVNANTSPDALSISTSEATPGDSAPAPEASPAAAPAPEPKFVFGGRDDYRIQLAIGLAVERFHSSIFNATAIGENTEAAYFTNNWFAFEGNVSATFAPEIFQNEHVKLLTYGAGPKIAWRQSKWEPWMHAILGGAHEQPQTAGNSRNAFAIQAGGGVDYRINPRLSARAEVDWVRTSFFSQTQNNVQFSTGIVFHF
jgi:hypothetical protein